jgi:Flp pilus assembly pilin Flp
VLDRALARFSTPVSRATEGETMLKVLRRLVREESAQDLAEYGIALATISILAGIAAVFIAGDVGSLWSRAQSVIDSAATAS